MDLRSTFTVTLPQAIFRQIKTMARKKAAATALKSAAERTTASVFVDGSLKEMENSASTAAPESENGAQLEEIPSDTKLPLALLYQLQDFLNENMTWAKSVQLLVCLYISQILWLYMTQNGYEDAMYSVGFNILGVVLAIYLSYRSQKRKHELNPEVYEYPPLPEFNTIYSMLIPTLFVILMADYKNSFFQSNLALSNFAIKSLHPVAKVVSAFVFYYMYNEESNMELFEFMRVVWVYYTIDFSLSAWNEIIVTDEDGNTTVSSTLSNAEIHFIAMACVNLLCQLEVLPLNPATTPLFILRILVLSLVIACAVSFPVYFLYKRVSDRLVAFGLSIVLVGAFCSSFYYSTNYFFDLFVSKKEVLQWLYEHISESLARTALLSSWTLALIGSITVMFVLSQSSLLSLNMRRKLWHFLLVAALTKPIVDEPEFTTLAVLGSSGIFVVIEFLRCTEVTFVGRWLNSKLRLFQDEKDLVGPLNLSYIFLLLGVGIPLAYDSAVQDLVSIRSYLGLATLGLGDSAASIVGKNFGKTKWKGEVKTFEGTVTYVVATFAYLFFVDHYILPDACKVSNWENLVIVSIIGGLIEGTASLNDNVLVPAITLISYEALNRVFPGTA